MIIIPYILRQFKFSAFRLLIRFNTKNCEDLTKWIKFKNTKMPPYRENPVIMKLDTPEFRSIFTPELNILKNLFKKNNHELRIAGGAVRDILTGLIPKDIDFATTATPTEMKKLFNDEGIRMLNANGEKHGTITARINDRANFEITTLRIDVVTDGRRANIEFTTDWRLDANRRDLTINSMFLDFEGHVYDYFFGYDDLQKKRIVFVGDAERRLQEDYLRILRYFRFYGRIADVANCHDENTIEAIKKNVDGMVRISGERIWNEWHKILTGNFGVELTIKMLECGLKEHIGLPKNPDIDNFIFICERAKSMNLTLNPMTMIVAMLKDSKEVMDLFTRLHLPAVDRDLGFFIVNYRNIECSTDSLYPFQCLLVNSNNTKNTREYINQVMKYKGMSELLDQFQKWTPPKFPITGHDLKSYVPHLKLIAPTLQALKEIWLKDNCQTSANDLILQVPDIVTALKVKYEPLLSKKTKKA